MSARHAVESVVDARASEPQGDAPRVLIDCTQTLATLRHAGIPRVVRNIARYGVAASARHGATIVPVRFEDNHFLALSLSSAGDIVDVVDRPPVRNAHPVLRRLHKLLVPRTIVQAIRTQWRRIVRRPLPGTPIEFRPNDTLLLADSSWATRYWHVVDRARKAGTRVGVVQYDFIPHTHPEFVTERLAATYRGWMKNTLTRADFVAAISEAVADEARNELQRMGRDPDRAAPLVHSDLAYRALLRNLALLAGMRNGKSSFDVLVTGVGASAVAARLRRLEPAVRTDVVGNDIAADFGARGFVSITPP